MPLFSRRSFSSSLCAAAILGWTRKTHAIGPGAKVGIGHIRHGGDWDPSPESMRRILWETGKRTSIDAKRDAKTVLLEEDELFQFPLLFLTGTSGFPEFSAKARLQLGRHLRYGGLLYIDGASSNNSFWESISRELSTIFPSSEMARLKHDHVLYKSFFLLDKILGRSDTDPWAYGLDLHDRTAVIATKTDVLSALERDKLGTWKYECMPGGERQREQAIRFSINLMMYATCLDYKTDQVHIPFIMKKKRR